MAAALGVEIFSRGFRFNPTPLEAVTYYIPRLIAGAPLHEAVRPVVHHADVLTLKGASYRLRNRGIDTLPSIKTQDAAH